MLKTLEDYMLFDHKAAHLPEINTTTIDGKRYYITPEGNKYPSITTVLSDRGKEGIVAWRKKVGEDKANHITRAATNRGTKFHTICEDYLNNKDVTKHKKDFLPYAMFIELKNSLMMNINNIRAQECGLYSDKYKVAGRVDCIAKYNDVLSIIDFKTSTKERSDAWNENYYIQGSAYAEMFSELTGIDISQVVILVVTEDGTVQEFIKDKSDFLDALTDSIAEWKKENETDNKGRPIHN